MLSLGKKNVVSPRSADGIARHLSLSEPIKKIQNNGFYKKEKPNITSKDKALKEDCQLFAKLFISCQNREYNLYEYFFRDEKRGQVGDRRRSLGLKSCREIASFYVIRQTRLNSLATCLR